MKSHIGFWKRVWGVLWADNGWLHRPEAPTDDEPASKPAEKEPEEKKVTLTVGGATAVVEVPCCCDEAAGGDGEKDEEAEEGTIGATVLKVAAWAATGITATGFITVVGAALFWVRFNEVGLPATQAVGLLSRSEQLVQGAQVTIVYVAIALVAVLLVYFVDPKGKLVKVSLLLLLVLTLAGIGYVLGTELGGLAKLGLAVGSVVLLAGVIVVGLSTGQKFWPLALAVFVATLVYSASTGLLVVDQQSYVQAVAVLRSDTDAGLRGVYVTATSDTIYLGRLSVIDADEKDGDRRAMFDVPRSGAIYAVGPLESVEKAEARSRVMLAQLIQDRERDPGPPEPPASGSAPDESTGSKEGDGSEGGEGATAASGGATATEPTTVAPADTEGSDTEKAPEPAAKPVPDPVETVAKAFGSTMTVHSTVEGKWTCLVRYAAAGSSLLGRFWTSCEDNRRLAGKTMLEVRDALALPSRFQPIFDMKVVASLPAGAPVTYLEGPIGDQCEHEAPAPCGHRYPGGGEQIYLPDPQQVENPQALCTATRQDEVPDWVECES